MLTNAKYGGKNSKRLALGIHDGAVVVNLYNFIKEDLTVLRRQGAEILDSVNEGPDIVYLKLYTEAEQKARDEGNGYHPGHGRALLRAVIGGVTPNSDIGFLQHLFRLLPVT